MNPESNTPRTDTFRQKSDLTNDDMWDKFVAACDFARQLERELAMANDAASKGAEGRGLGTALDECAKAFSELKAAATEFRDANFYFDCTKATWGNAPKQIADSMVDDMTKAAIRKNRAHERLDAALK